jgi:hypothetical protein
VVGAIVVVLLVGLFAFLLVKRRRGRDNEPKNVPVDEPKMEQQDLPSGRLQYLDEGPMIDSDDEVPPTFNSY